MINKFKYLLLGGVLAVGLAFSFPNGDNPEKDKVIVNLVYNVLNSSHYAPQKVDDEFSSKVFDHFIENLDYSKRFLLAQDVRGLEKYRNKLDEEYKNAELNFFNEAFEIYTMRFDNAKGYFEAILSEPFDFTIDEDFETDEEKLQFAETEEELKDRWRLYLKQRVLGRVEESMHDQQKALEKKDTAVEQKTFAELEKVARDKELEMHEEWFENLEDLERIDWVGVYMNSITNIYDPHTQYFAPERKEDFEISMTGQLEGIGAQLQQKGEYITISKVITGSACWKQGDLEEGDKILKVAQEGDEKNPVDLVGMSVRKAVKYIRGPKGTTVILTVQKVDGSKMVVPIVRDVVELEATFAKSAVLGEGDEKIGYIRLPKFYVDFYGEANHDCAEDVKAEIEKLKKDNVKGIVLDLRNNGGGTLQGVIDIVGLFIDNGPVVQVKASGATPKVLSDNKRDIAYDGPLVVMVNQFSASASEIFAAAIQDYKRGVIIGSRSTFGKGTVQNIFDMDRAVNFTYNDMKPLGALKLTIQKYYRINGGTPQLKGVVPEIVLPDNYNYIEFGEKEEEFALPYDEIAPAKYTVWTKGTDKYPMAIANSNKRVEDNPKFALIDEYAHWLKEERENTLMSLNYEKYRAEQDDFRVKSEKYEDMRKTEDSIMVSSNTVDIPMWDATEDKQKERDRWFKNLQTDIYLHEAFEVAKDLKQ